jgi:uncharacterized surface protein with fasciclin (FAS1) repeats
MRKLTFLSGLLLLSLAACGGGQPAPAAASTETSADGGDAATPAATKDIVDTAVEAGQFTKLAAALQAAGLVDTLKGPGPFTVFAPTDEAFAKLPPGALDDLLKPENKQKLADLLTYHVVAGKVTSADVVKLKSAKTVLGKEVTIDASDGVKVDNAKVVKADIEASNGVIHVIDTVIMPK